jgi:hypothetical protein
MRADDTMSDMTAAILHIEQFEETRPFEPGTTGWTVDDLDDPEIERKWFAGRYEIVEGVLTTIPPAYFDGSLAQQNLVRMIERHLDCSGAPGRFAPAVDFIIAPRRLARG